MNRRTAGLLTLVAGWFTFTLTMGLSTTISFASFASGGSLRGWTVLLPYVVAIGLTTLVVVLMLRWRRGLPEAGPRTRPPARWHETGPGDRTASTRTWAPPPPAGQPRPPGGEQLPPWVQEQPVAAPPPSDPPARASSSEQDRALVDLGWEHLTQATQAVIDAVGVGDAGQVERTTLDLLTLCEQMGSMLPDSQDRYVRDLDVRLVQVAEQAADLTSLSEGDQRERIGVLAGLMQR